MFETFGDLIIFVPYIGIQQDGRFANKKDYFKHLERIKQPDTRLWFSLHLEEKDYTTQLEVVRRICG
jgi:hypothetical protein